MLSDLYRQPLALLTDLYQLTMAYGYWKHGLHERESVFHLCFRSCPFKGGYAVACGLETAIELCQGFRFEAGDRDYLGSLRGNDGRPLFDAGFLEYLKGLTFSCDLDAILEGSAVFPHEPLLRVRGPLCQAQILETALLNVLNFQTLIATKAARVATAAAGEPVLEFGLRRAQGIDGALAASRAAYVGGCAATSNVLAGKLFGIPVRGTHAHSWVMVFDTEVQAFDAYAEAMPNNCVFLVDTYDTAQGVHHAVEVGRRLRAGGHELAGIRLDSGDLAALAKEARRILDAAGFPRTAIVASNDLDEHLIASLKSQGAPIGVWGVGTKLATAYDQPALGGVYKLSAIRDEAGAWQDRVKLSEQAIKVSTPGILAARRFTVGGHFWGDVVYDERSGLEPGGVMVDPLDHTLRQWLPQGAPSEELLTPVFRGGRRVGPAETVETARARAAASLAMLPPGVKRFMNPHRYPVGLAQGLYDLKTRLILEARGFQP